jgi:K+-sensing histidine kinase KdpD
VPAGIDKRFSKHLFLIPRSNVVKFQDEIGNAEAAILLKPMTRACLTAFLGRVACQQRMSTDDTLRVDRDEILQCLIHANLRLQEYDQDRTNFLARALHDFRAPLTASNGYCGLLLSEALGSLSGEQIEVLHRMQHSIKRLSRMACAMFELSIGLHVKRQPELRSAEIRDCVEQALHEVAPFADGKNIAVSVDLDCPLGALYLESDHIEQTLINLLDNACKFTPKNGSIDIRGYACFWERRNIHRSPMLVTERRRKDCEEPNSYRMDIRGSGPLIPREHLGRIFEEYTSYGGGQDRSGGGLGLAICKMIINAHSGRIWAENTEDGPCFSFILPVHSTDAGEPVSPSTEQHIPEAAL